MKKLFLLCFLFLLITVACFSQQVSVPIIISDGTPSGKDTLMFGLDPSATDCIDPLLGEYELPPTPPAGVFDARFVGTNIGISCLGQGIKYDYRLGNSDFVGTKMHQIKYQPGTGTTITIYWSLPAGITGRLFDVILGTIVNDTMYGSGSLIVNDPTVFTSLKMRINYLPPPAQPSLFSPSNGLTCVGLIPLLDWNDVTGSVTYHVQVASDNLFSSLIINDSTLTVSQYSVASGMLNNFTKYYWRVNAKNTSGISSYSTVFNFTTLLSAPSLLTPVSGTMDLPLNSVLDWSNVNGAIKYWLQVSTDSNFTITNLSDSSITTSQYSFSAGILANFTKYYWRVKAIREGCSGNWSVKYNFTTLPLPPTAPVLTSPLNNATNVQIPVTLDWNDVATATKYWVQVSTNSGFSNFIVNDSTVTVSQFAITSGILSYNTQYYWRVYARNINNWGDASLVWNFTTIIPPPVAPVLLLPANNAANVQIPVTLDWNDVATATKYRVQVSTNTGFTSFVVNDSTATVSQFAIGAGILSYNTQYYWRVYARNVNNWGDPSSVWNFTTQIPPPTAPVLVSPVNNAVNVILPLTLDWNDVANATKYWVQISLNSGFTSFIVNDSTPISSQFAVPSGVLSLNTLYYWRVYARNINTWGDPSSVWNFTTIIPPPAAPVLLLPANNAANVQIPVTLDWNDVATATKYRVQVSTNTGFTSFVVNDSTATVSQFAIGAGILSYNTQYYWRVYARNVNNWGDPSSVWNFTTEIPPPVAPTLISPPNGAINLVPPITLDWNDVPTANSYRLQLSLDSNFTTTLLNDSTITVSQFILPALPTLVKIYWRVNAKNSTSTSPFSSKWNFTILGIPPAPILISPANDTLGLGPIVKLDWLPITPVLNYKVQIATDSNFVNLITDTTVAVDSMLTRPLIQNTTYFWRVNASNVIGTGAWSNKWKFSISVVGMNFYSMEIPKKYNLHNNFPNPFNPSTKIRFDLPKKTNVKILIYDLSGREIKILVDEDLDAGAYEYTFSASNLSSGIYFYRMITDSYRNVKRMVLIK